MKDVVAILSGGIDSSTMLWLLEKRRYNVVEALTFDYGQKHKKEIEKARLVMESFNKHFDKNAIHKIVDLSSIKSLISKGALTGDTEVPQDMYDKETQHTTIVPNRNMIMIAIAAGRAVTIDAPYVAYAAHAGDSIYPDCSLEFVEKMSKSLLEANKWTPVDLLAPFTGYTKRDIVRVGITVGVPYELTWSCYKGEERPCLSCGTCLERTEAFLLNNSKDPALNNKEWDDAVKIYTHKKSAKGEIGET